MMNVLKNAMYGNYTLKFSYSYNLAELLKFYISNKTYNTPNSFKITQSFTP